MSYAYHESLTSWILFLSCQYFWWSETHSVMIIGSRSLARWFLNYGKVSQYRSDELGGQTIVFSGENWVESSIRTLLDHNSESHVPREQLKTDNGKILHCSFNRLLFTFTHLPLLPPEPLVLRWWHQSSLYEPQRSRSACVPKCR